MCVMQSEAAVGEHGQTLRRRPARVLRRAHAARIDQSGFAAARSMAALFGRSTTSRDATPWRESRREVTDPSGDRRARADRRADSPSASVNAYRSDEGPSGTSISHQGSCGRRRVGNTRAHAAPLSSGPERVESRSRWWSARRSWWSDRNRMRAFLVDRATRVPGRCASG